MGMQPSGRSHEIESSLQALAELLTTNKLSELACLTLYLMYEKKNGKQSVWYEFIKVCRHCHCINCSIRQEAPTHPYHHSLLVEPRLPAEAQHRQYHAPLMQIIHCPALQDGVTREVVSCRS